MNTKLGVKYWGKNLKDQRTWWEPLSLPTSTVPPFKMAEILSQPCLTTSCPSVYSPPNLSGKLVASSAF